MGHTFKEVVEASTKYFNDITSAEVFANKYALKAGPDDYRELTPDDMHKRLAKEFARIEEKFGGPNKLSEQQIYEAFANFKRIVPQGSPMTAIGNKFSLMSASNCTVVASPKDDLGDIMLIGTEMAQLMKRRCGVGVDISNLRPSGMKVNNAATSSSGAYSFADYYSYITRMIGQKGRQGALMVTMDILHPDSPFFATMKKDKMKVTGANVSLRIGNEFMEAVDKKKKVTLRWPLTGKPKDTREVDANSLFNIIVESAHQTGDPGLLMWDNITKNLPAHYYDEFNTICTNPCAEIPLSAYDSCRLISLNLTAYVNAPFEPHANFDFDRFKADVAIATRLSDDLVELELELVRQIRDGAKNKIEKKLWHKLHEAARLGRRIGLGTHGLGDALAQLRMKYNSDNAMHVTGDIYAALRDNAYTASINLAKERGAFPVFNWEKEKSCEFFKRMPSAILNVMKVSGRRNISLLTNAPTGTVAMMSKTTSGIEPIFRLEYLRRVKIHGNQNLSVDFIDEMGEKWHHYNIFHHNFIEYCRIAGIKLDPKKSLKDQKIEIPDFFTTSEKLDHKWNILLLAKVQDHIDHGVSCTINMPKSTTTDMVRQVYIDAWKIGLKGVTVYVEGSKAGVLVSDEHGVAVQPPSWKKRPIDLPCELHMTTCQGKRWLVIVGLRDGRPYEVFAGRASDLPMPRDVTKAITRKMGKHQYSIVYEEAGEEIFVPIKESFLEQNGMMVRLLINQSLRHGVPLDVLYDTVAKSSDITDFSRTVVRTLKGYMSESNYKPKCFNCNSTNVKPVDGCYTCIDCGNSKCG